MSFPNLRNIHPQYSKCIIHNSIFDLRTLPTKPGRLFLYASSHIQLHHLLCSTSFPPWASKTNCDSKPKQLFKDYPPIKQSTSFVLFAHIAPLLVHLLSSTSHRSLNQLSISLTTRGGRQTLPLVVLLLLWVDPWIPLMTNLTQSIFKGCFSAGLVATDKQTTLAEQ